jgi:hypothetical protein
MNIVDSLVIALNLDASGFKKGTDDATASMRKTRAESTKYGKEMEAAGKRVGETIAKVTIAFLSLAAVLTGGRAFKDFIKDIGDSDLAINRLAHSLGERTETLSAFEMAMERAGLSAADADSSFQSLNNTIQELRVHGTGGGGLNMIAAMAEQSGVRGSSFEGLKSNSDYIYRLARDLEGIKRAKGAATASYMGQHDAGLTPGATSFLMQGEAAVRAAVEKSKQLGTAGEKSAAAWAGFVDKLRTLQQTAAEFGRVLLTRVTPALTGILDKMTAWITKDENVVWLSKQINDAFDWLVDILGRIDFHAIIEGAKSFVKDVNDIVEALGGWKAVAKDLFALWVGAQFAKVLANVALLVVALATGNPLGGALALLGLIGSFLLGTAFLTWLDNKVGAKPGSLGGEVPREGGAGTGGGETSSRASASEWQGGGSNTPAPVDLKNPVLRAIHAASKGDAVIEKRMQDIYSGESGHKNHWDVGDVMDGGAYGPFQFNMGKNRLGWQFQQETKLDPRDPKNLQAMADYTAAKLIDMRKRGQNPASVWHGIVHPNNPLTGGYAPGLKLEGDDKIKLEPRADGGPSRQARNTLLASAVLKCLCRACQVRFIRMA